MSFYWGQSCKSTSDIAINLPMFKSCSVWTLDKSYNTSAGGHRAAALTQGSLSLSCRRLCGLIHCDITHVPHFAAPIDNGTTHLRSKICKSSPKSNFLWNHIFVKVAFVKIRALLNLHMRKYCTAYSFYAYETVWCVLVSLINSHLYLLATGCRKLHIYRIWYFYFFFSVNANETNNWLLATFTGSFTQ